MLQLLAKALLPSCVGPSRLGFPSRAVKPCSDTNSDASADSKMDKNAGQAIASLLALPDGVLAEIARHLGPVSIATLQTTCKHLDSLLGHDRLWQEALQEHDPVWVKSGVCPLSGRHNSQTWKQLVGVSVQLQPTGIGGDVRDTPQAVCVRGLNLWNTANLRVREEVKVHLDYHLCHTEHQSSQWRLRLPPHHFTSENIADLMELIYFMWHEARQLARACKMLLKVIGLLKEDRAYAGPEAAEECLGYSSLQAASCAACIATYLIDLLHMRTLRLSPMSAADPDDFLKACQGQTASDAAAFAAKRDTFEWCGGVYTYSDLTHALSLICVPEKSASMGISSTQQYNQHHTDSIVSLKTASDAASNGELSQPRQPVLTSSFSPASPVSPLLYYTSSGTSDGWPCQDQQKADQHLQCGGMSLSQQFCDPWMPDSWELLTSDAQSLLYGLAAAEYIPWDKLQRSGGVLKAKVTNICRGRAEGSLAPSDVCRGFTLYAASTCLNRMHEGPDRHTVYAETGNLFESGKQYSRAAHFYKLHIMATTESGFSGLSPSLARLAAAYDWDSIASGALQSYRQAFAWQRCLVRSLLQHEDQRTALVQQANILGDMLSSGNTGNKCAPHLHRNSRLVLAVGAYQFAKRQTTDGRPVVAWLQDCMEMLAVAEQAFVAFLESAQEAFMIMTQHAARRRAVHEQAIQNNSGNNSVATRTVRSPPIVFTVAHVEFMTKLGDVLAGLPRGSAGQPLYAIAASIKRSMAVA